MRSVVLTMPICAAALLGCAWPCPAWCDDDIVHHLFTEDFDHAATASVGGAQLGAQGGCGCAAVGQAFDDAQGIGQLAIVALADMGGGLVTDVLLEQRKQLL